LSDIIKAQKPAGGAGQASTVQIRHALGPFEADVTPRPRIVQPASQPPGGAARPGSTPPEEVDRMLKAEYLRGVEDGKAAGARAAREECEQQIQVRDARFAGIEKAIREQLAAAEERIVHEAYHFALAIAGKIVKKEVTIDSDIVIRQVQEALRRVTGVDSVKLKLSPLDEAAVRERRSELLSAADSVHDLVIESDEKIEQGGCILETASGTVDARTSTQLEQIEAALFEQTLS
jgi:flagellar biosynthesis/type III secretory pathway protein FliH